MTDPAEALEKALERNLLSVEHDRPLILPVLTLGQVLGYPFDSNRTRNPRRWKCSRWVCPMLHEVNEDRVFSGSLSESSRPVNVLWGQPKDSGRDKKSTVLGSPGLSLVSRTKCRMFKSGADAPSRGPPYP